MVSGDLTSEGSPSEFPVAHTFLRAFWRLRRDIPMKSTGVDLSDDRLGIVPGNHDHWNGQHLGPVPIPQSYNKSIFPKHFRPTPWKKVWKDMKGQIELEIYGLDSNSGLAGNINIRAMGSFSNYEVQQLEAWLNESDQQPANPGVHRVRAIVTHHSPSYTGAGPLGLMLDANSRQKLYDIALKYGIACVLTGHVHDSAYVKIDIGQGKFLWEFRSATTLQGTPKPGVQGFLGHRIWLKSDQPWWSMCRYSWGSHAFFRKEKAFCVEFQT